MTADSPRADEQVAAVGWLRRLRRANWSGYVVYIGFAVVFLFFSVTQTQYFLSVPNLLNIVIQAAPIAVMAVGAVFVLSAREIDISFSSVVALSALIAAMVVQYSGLWWIGALAALTAGALVGLVNGFFVTVVRLPSFLVTLATMGLVAGVARQLTNLQSVPITDDTFIYIFGGGKVLGTPILLWWIVVVVIVGIVYLRHKRYGAHVLAVGNNQAAARMSGINVGRIRMLVLVGMSVAAALAGLLYAGRLEGARYSLGGEADLMTVLAAVIIGGTSLFGGRASVIGALVGSLLMTMINNGLIIAGLTVSQQMIVRGVIILGAVSLSLRAKKNA